MTFSGSYDPADVTFLLKRIEIAPISVAEKETLIQSGQRHYSEMISPENPPSARYLELFYEAISQNRSRMATDLSRLATALAMRHKQEVVLVSLARAGTPIGVLLRRGLRILGVPCTHYSISIVRDRGIDAVALDYILSRHSPDGVVFIDGWTGKGAIAAELHSSVTAYNASRGVSLPRELTVLTDLAGVAGLASTSDDYLIPPSILNSVVSGLISRTILNSTHVQEGDFHACVVYEDLRKFDLSRWFVDTMTEDLIQVLGDRSVEVPVWDDRTRARLRAVSEQFVLDCQARYGVKDRNRVKPGIGEATRALLRRMPERTLLKDPEAQDTRHLLFLAQSRGIPVEHCPELPYRAATIIRSLGAG